MQIGIRKAVSTISIRAMPSMPSAQAKRPKIGVIFGELPLRPADLIGGPEADAERERRRAWSASAIQRAPLAPAQQAGERAEQRQRQDRREDREARQHHRAIAQVAAAATPSSITSA